MILEKKILQTDFKGKKPCKEIPRGEKFLHWKKISDGVSYWKKSLALLYVGEKNLSLEVWRKKFLPKQNHPYPPPPSRVKWSALKHFFFSFFCSVYCSHIWFERSLLLTQVFTFIASKLFMTI